jgi:transposase
MHSINIKDSAKKLRKSGLSIRNIAKKLGVSFSTVSFWCRDIRLSSSVIKRMDFLKNRIQ